MRLWRQLSGGHLCVPLNVPSCACAGAPVSALPGRLRAVVCRGMEQVQAVLVEAQRAQAAAPSAKLNVLGARMPCLACPPFDPRLPGLCHMAGQKPPLLQSFMRLNCVVVACSQVA